MGKCVEGCLDFDFFIGNVFWGQFFWDVGSISFWEGTIYAIELQSIFSSTPSARRLCW